MENFWFILFCIYITISNVLYYRWSLKWEKEYLKKISEENKVQGVTMPKIIFENVKIPNTCGECEHCGHYETGPYARNPHCCCELIWELQREDYRVDKNSLDEDCPLKVGYLEI